MKNSTILFKQNIVSFVLALIFILVQTVSSFGQERWIQYLDVVPNQSSAIVIVEDDKFQTSEWSTIESTQFSEAKVLFEVDNDALQFSNQAFSFSAQVQVELWRIDDGTSPSYSQLETFQIDYDPNAESTIASKSFKTYENVHKMRLTVNSVLPVGSNWNGNAPPMRIHGEIIVGRKYLFSDNVSPTFSSFFSAVQTNTYTPFWQIMDGAEEYDLEWTFYDKESKVGQDIVNGVATNYQDFDFLFRNNANRISIGNTLYEIQLLYPEGYVFFRVRGVRTTADGVREYSAWSSAGLNHSLVNFPHQIEVAPHDGNTINWQSSQVFAEEGKNVPSVNYYDGTLRSRQQVTLSHDIDRTIVGQTLYDFHGRPAINVLPTPSESNVIQFDPDFVERNNSTFTKSDFDVCECENNSEYFSPKPLDLTGAAKYYSTANPEKNSGKHQYIPDANGFVYTQTQYTPDLTGRVFRQGGVGEDFALGSGNETVYMYDKPAQVQLDRLFGNDAGFNNHYFRNVVIDPNGQGTISYVDMHGRTIATALVGGKPDNVEVLDTGMPAQEQITYNIINDQREDFALISTYPLSIIFDGTVSFDYDLNALMADMECLDQNICYDCLYDVEIRIVDKACNTFNQKQPLVFNFSNYTPGTSIDTLCTENSNGGALHQTGSFSLPQGQYTITKTLKLLEEPLDEYTEHFLSQSSCVPDLNVLIQEYINTIDTTGCTMDCNSCVASLGSETDYVNNLIAEAQMAGVTITQAEAEANYQGHVASCESLCYEPTECDILLGSMANDMYPGGQYAEFDVDLINDLYSTTDPTSIYYQSRYQTLPGSLIYLDENGLPDMVKNENGVLVPPTALGIKEFISAFKSSWAITLVEAFHPEYCLYDAWCLQTNNVDDCNIIGSLETWFDAVASGYVDATGVISDPCFTGATGGTGGPGGDCIDFRDSLLANYAGTQSLVDFVSIQIYGSCQNGLGSGSHAQNKLAWDLYRTLYLGIMQLIKEKIWETLDDCNSDVELECIGLEFCDGQANPIWKDKDPRFFRFHLDDLDNSLFDNVDLATWEQEQFADCQLTCELSADQWISQLQGCGTLDPAIEAELRLRLIAVCQGACDMDHLEGASSMPPGQLSSEGDASFEEVVNSLIPSAADCDANCSALNITGIYPYEVEPYGGNIPIFTLANSSVCDILTDLEACYNALPANSYPSFFKYLAEIGETVLTPYDIDSLQTYCSAGKVFLPDAYTLPPYLECGICKTCDEMAPLLTDFNAICSTSSPSYSLLRSRYFNHHLGFDLFPEDYDLFFQKCNDATACDASSILCPTSGEFSEYEEYEDPVTCWDLAVISAELDARTAYENILDSLRQVFRTQYISSCLGSIENQDHTLPRTQWLEQFDVHSKDQEYHHTLYYYDQSGHLVQTVPPNGVQKITNATNLEAVRAHRLGKASHPNPIYPNHSFYTKYQYNTLGQVVKQISPDIQGETEFWYDKVGRLVFSQDARQRAISAYSYTKYDGLGRVTEVGEKEKHPAFPDMDDDLAKNPGLWLNGSPASSRTQIVRTYYDSEKYDISAFDNSEQLNLRTRVASVTFEAVDDGNQNTYDFASHYSYDLSGNVVTLVQEVDELHTYGHGYKRMDYDFDYHSGKVNSVFYQKGKADQFTHRYEYDQNNRLTNVYTSMVETDHEGLLWEREASYDYYDHGPLARTEIGQHNVQGMDYAYTLQGWIKGVNSSGLVPEKDMGKDGALAVGNHRLTGRDAFGYSLSYFDGEYQQIGNDPFEMTASANSNLNSNSNSLYNGNIRYMSIHNKKLGDPIAYSYSYDQLHRIKSMQSFQDADLTNFSWGSGTTSSAYSMNTSYDGNGNIQKMLRYAQQSGTLNSVPINDIDYDYIPGTNLLQGTTESGSQCFATINVTEPVQQSTTLEAGQLLTANSTVTGEHQVAFQSDDDVDLLPGFETNITGSGCFIAEIEDCPPGTPVTSGYQYDEIGNLIVNEDGARISWNPYGKVLEVDHPTENRTVSYNYDPAQNRAVKAVTNTNTGTTDYTYYMRDASGNVMGIYQRRQDTVNWKEHYLYGSNRLGSVKPNVLWSAANPLPDAPYFEDQQTLYAGWKGYELSNHLGNVMTVVNDRKTVVDVNGDLTADYYEGTVLSASDYYPFGLEMQGRKYSGGSYRFGFNGKEKDENGEWGSGTYYDYGFRIYNPGIGKFLSVDPLTKGYPELTPYQFASNTPIMGVDLDGLELLNIHSADFTKQFLALDLDGKSAEYVMTVVNDFATRYGKDYGGYFNENSRSHAEKFYGSQGAVVSEENPNGPLTVYGYTNATKGDVTRYIIYQAEQIIEPEKNEESAEGLQTLEGLQYGLASFVNKSPFGLFNRALHNKMEGKDIWTGKEGDTGKLLRDGTTSLLTMGTGPASAILNLTLNGVEDVVDVYAPGKKEEIGVVREIIDVGMDINDLKTGMFWIEFSANLYELGSDELELIEKYQEPVEETSESNN